jgi:hypothetical protein
MNLERESLRLWLEEVSPGSATFHDSKYTLVWKLVEHYGGTPSHNDLYVPLIAKLAAVVSGSAPPFGNRLVDEASNPIVDGAGNNLVWF